MPEELSKKLKVARAGFVCLILRVASLLAIAMAIVFAAYLQNSKNVLDEYFMLLNAIVLGIGGFLLLGLAEILDIVQGSEYDEDEAKVASLKPSPRMSS